MPLGLANPASAPSQDADVSGRPCVKCPSPAAVVGSGQEAYCRPCYLLMVAHKFRGCLGRRRVFERPGEAVLVGVDGGPPAAALLHLLHAGLNGHPKKRLTIAPTLLAVISATDAGEMEDQSAKLGQYLGEQGWPWKLIHLGCVLLDPEERTAAILRDPTSTPLPGLDKAPALAKLMSSVGSRTAALELRRGLKTWLLLEAARVLGLSRVLLGSTGTALAARVLGAVVLGRGPDVGPETSLVDVRGPPTFIRPLRDLSDREIGLFNHFEGVSAVLPTERAAGQGSIQDVTADFLSSLTAAGFPGTVPTLLSSAAKVVSVETTDSTCEPCALCRSLSTSSDQFCVACASIISEVSNPCLLPTFLKV